MINLSILTLLMLIIPVMLMFINMLISKKMFFDREKASAYECGFDPLNSTSESFSIQFFLISIMFLTFDMEIVILIPMIPAININHLYWLISSFTVLSTLIIGVFLEWSENSIKWQK